MAAGIALNVGNGLTSIGGITNHTGVTNLSNNVTIGPSATFTTGSNAVTFGNCIFAVGSNATAATFSGNLTVLGRFIGNLNGFAANASNANLAGGVAGANVSGDIIGKAGSVTSITGATGNLTVTNGSFTTGLVVGGGTLPTTTGHIQCVQLNASTDVVVTSDRRLKTNIFSIENSLSTVNGMRGVFYTLLSDPAHRKVGVIAQEMEQALPEVVSTDNTEEKIKGVAYSQISAVLIEAVKELTQRMERVERMLNLR